MLPLVGKSKVDNLHLQSLGGTHEKILGFEVPVCDLLRVQVLDTLGYLGEKFPGVTFAEVAVLLEPAEELSAFAKTEWTMRYS